MLPLSVPAAETAAAEVAASAADRQLTVSAHAVGHGSLSPNTTRLSLRRRSVTAAEYEVLLLAELTLTTTPTLTLTLTLTP